MIQTIILTLVIYSAISTITWLITNENEEVAMWFGLGLCGILVVLITRILSKIYKWNKYRNKRSIIYCAEDGIDRYCKLRDTDDIYFWHDKYHLKKRYADKSEWQSLEPFNKIFIRDCKRNCDNCIHDGKECPSGSWDKALCKQSSNYESFKAK